MAQFVKKGLAGDGFTCIDVERAEFGFCCQGHDGFDDLEDVKNGAVVGLPAWLRTFGLLR